MQLTEPAADVLRAAYRQAMLERREIIDLAVVKQAAALARGVLLENLGGGTRAEGTGDAASLREARWWVRRQSAFTPTDPPWGAAVVAALPELVRRLPGEPYTPLLGLLSQVGALEERTRAAAWTSRLKGRLLHRADKAGGPVLVALELEAARQAMLLEPAAVPPGAAATPGTGRAVDSAAVLLAVLSLDEQLSLGKRELRAAYRAANEGGALLRARGVRTPSGVDVPEEKELAARQVAWGHTPADPPWTTAAAAVWDAARAQGGTTHLVRALGEVDAPAAAALLELPG